MENREIKKQFIASMTAPRLVSELLGQAVADLHQADVAMLAGDYELSNLAFIHAQNVLAELQATLRQGDKDTQQAVDFLDCLLEQLFYANVNGSRHKLLDAARMLERLQTVYMLSFDPRES